MPTASSLAWKTSLRKVRTLWHCSRLLLRHTAIDVRYPSGNRLLQQYLGHCRALVMVSSEHKADSLIAKFKEAGVERSERLMWLSRVTAIILARLSASSSACHGLLIITVITLLPTPVTKMPENWSWRTRQLLTCRCVSVMLRCLMRMKELADAKAENDALRDDVAVIVVGCTSGAESVSQCVKPLLRLRRG